MKQETNKKLMSVWEAMASFEGSIFGHNGLNLSTVKRIAQAAGLKSSDVFKDHTRSVVFIGNNRITCDYNNQDMVAYVYRCCCLLNPVWQLPKPHPKVELAKEKIQLLFKKQFPNIDYSIKKKNSKIFGEYLYMKFRDDSIEIKKLRKKIRMYFGDIPIKIIDKDEFVIHDEEFKL